MCDAEFFIFYAEFFIFDAEFFIFDAEFFIFDAEILIYDAEFFIFDAALFCRVPVSEGFQKADYHVRYASRDDEGEYRCIANNGALTREEVVRITVHEQQRGDIFEEDSEENNTALYRSPSKTARETYVGSTVELDCQVSKYKLRFRKEYLPNGRKYIILKVEVDWADLFVAAWKVLRVKFPK